GRLQLGERNHRGDRGGEACVEEARLLVVDRLQRAQLDTVGPRVDGEGEEFRRSPEAGAPVVRVHAALRVPSAEPGSIGTARAVVEAHPAVLPPSSWAAIMPRWRVAS